MTMPVAVMLLSSTRAMPKSMTLAWRFLPSRITRTLAGLMSRWMMPLRCAWLRPSQTWASTSRNWEWDSAWCLMTSSRSSPFTNSMTRKKVSPSLSKSKMVTMLGWLSLPAASASRRNRPSASSPLATLGRMVLMATSRPMAACLAR